MKLRIGFIILLVAHAPAMADFNSKARGTTTANFLKLGVGARAVGMGEAYAAVADDATALYWNPAAMTRIESSDAIFMHAPYLAETFYDYGAFAHRAGNHAFGIGVQYFSTGRLDQTDINNSDLGDFNPYDLAATVGVAHQFSEQGPSVGLAGKFIQSKILTTANAFAVDLGALSREYADRWRFAFTMTNIGSKMKFEEEEESLPLALRVGSSLKLTRSWLAALDFVAPKDNDAYVTFGTEYTLRVSQAMALAGRLGYNSLTAGDVSGVTGLSIGMGLGFERFAVDYALLPYGGVGITHRISLSFKFGAPPSAPRVLKR